MKEANIMAKLDNVLAILWMLSSDKKVTAKQISDKLEMNIRTVYIWTHFQKWCAYHFRYWTQWWIYIIK